MSSQPAKKDEKPPVERPPFPAFMDWLKTFQEFNQKLAETARPIEQQKETFKALVAPITSVGKQITAFSQLGFLEQPKIFPTAKAWDFVASGSNVITPTIPPSMIVPENRANYVKLMGEYVPLLQKKDEAAQAELEKVMTEEQVSSNLQDYQTSIVDATFASAGLQELAKHSLGRGRIRGRKSFSMTKEWLASLGGIVDRILTRLGPSNGLIGGLAKEAGELIGELKESAKKAGSSLKEKLGQLCSKFADLFLRLISGMFDFVRRIQVVAKEKQFSMTEIAVEISGAGVDVLTLFGLPIPIPKISPPKLIVKFSP